MPSFRAWKNHIGKRCGPTSRSINAWTPSAHARCIGISSTHGCVSGSSANRPPALGVATGGRGWDARRGTGSWASGRASKWERGAGPGSGAARAHGLMGGLGWDSRARNQVGTRGRAGRRPPPTTTRSRQCFATRSGLEHARAPASPDTYARLTRRHCRARVRRGTRAHFQNNLRVAPRGGPGCATPGAPQARNLMISGAPYITQSIDVQHVFVIRLAGPSVDCLRPRTSAPELYTRRRRWPDLRLGQK